MGAYRFSYITKMVAWTRGFAEDMGSSRWIKVCYKSNPGDPTKVGVWVEGGRCVWENDEVFLASPVLPLLKPCLFPLFVLNCML